MLKPNQQFSKKLREVGHREVQEVPKDLLSTEEEDVLQWEPAKDCTDSLTG